MNFEACLSLPRDPREAALIADNLEALGRALREWPTDGWAQLATSSEAPDGLFKRLALRTAQAALDAKQRKHAEQSAEAAAAVLRVLWPEASASRPEAAAHSDEDRLLSIA
jgi:hypothetical protein